MAVIDEIEARFRRSLLPPPDLKISGWADRYRMLSKESSAEPGRFSMSRTPYMREIVDTVGDPEVSETWVIKSSQVAYSENLNNIAGYFIHQDPASMLMVQPTLQMGEAYSKDRISPMIRDTPELTALVDDRSRTSGNTILQKKFPGGHLTICGANSPASLASRPIRVVLCDEIDRFPASAGDEGDPITLARRRQLTFWNAVFFAGGTPTVKGASRIDAGFQEGDQRYYYVAAPCCGLEQVLDFERLETDPESDHYGHMQCCGCGQHFTDRGKREMLEGGKWIATKPFRGIASFHIWAAYSPWMSWKAIADEYHRAKDDPQLLKTFYNTILGLAYEEAGDKPETDDLMKRRENYEPGGIPDEILIITAGVDVQGDRLEIEVVGWGVDEESWSLDYRTFPGNPLEQQVWKDLDEYLINTEFTRRDGVKLAIRSALIDSGGKGSKATGHVSDRVYKYVQGKVYRNIFACKGSSVAGQPILARVTKLKKPPIRLIMVGTDSAKDLIYARLELTGDGPGRCHFPLTYDRRYFEMLTAEEKIVEMKAGSPVMKWRPARDENGKVRTRNEALDCRVYALAGLRLMPVNLRAMGRKYTVKKAANSATDATPAGEKPLTKTPEKPPETPAKTPKAVQARRKRRGGGGWSVSAR